MTGDVCNAGGRRGTACRLYAGHRGPHLFRRSTEGAPLKVCPKCGRAQSLADAFQHRANGSVFSWCKTCNRAYAKDRRARKAAGFHEATEGYCPACGADRSEVDVCEVEQ